MSGFFSRWVPLLIGLVLGLALGLVYTWQIDPVEIVNSRPVLLRTDYRWDWVRMTALSYVAEGNLGRAQARLAEIAPEDIAGAMRALIEEYAAAGRPADTMRRLTALAEALHVDTPAMDIYRYTPVPSRVPTDTPMPAPLGVTATSTPPVPSPAPPTSLPRPTATPTPLPTSTFRLAQQELLCEPGVPLHIEVVVQDEQGRGLGGIDVWLMWPGGADHAVTGLKPKKGPGYADFDAEPETSYDLSTSALGMPVVTGLTIEPCPVEEGAQPMLGSWRIVLEPWPQESRQILETRQP